MNSEGTLSVPDPRGRPWHMVDDLKAAQTAAMQTLDDAVRAGKITDEDAAAIADVIRRGHVHGARKRITRAKRRRSDEQ